MKNTKNKETLNEIAVYLIFGVFTTIVAMGTYFGILWIGEKILKLSPDDKSFNAVRAVAEILQWLFAVLFAFFTNKKWVFTNADQSMSTSKQFIRFSASRLATLGVDAIITFGTVWILLGVGYKEISLIGIDISADLIAKLLASVVVVISNYVLSKIFVFKKNNVQ